MADTNAINMAIELVSQPGINRDKTQYDSPNYIDGQHTRWYGGKPRKMGGYRILDQGDEEIVRTLFDVNRGSSNDIYCGRASSVRYFNVSRNGDVNSRVDRTPAGFITNPENLWRFDRFTNAATTEPYAADNGNYIVGFASPCASNPSDETENIVYAGRITDNAPLVPVLTNRTEATPLTCSGWIIALPPLLVALGTDGIMRWCYPGMLNNWTDEADGTGSPNAFIPANSKILRAEAVPGANESSLLIYTSDTIYRASFQITGTTTLLVQWTSQTLQRNATIQSPLSVASYNQTLVWPGVDQFYIYNGTLSSLDNTMNSQYFYDNLNNDFYGKIFSVPIPKYREVWTFFPFGDAVENTTAVIINFQENTWYDTRLPRAAGIPAGSFPYPIMSSSEKTYFNTPSGRKFSYPIWQHEFGYDRQEGENIYPIEAYFETHILDLYTQNPTSNVLIDTLRVEPNFNMLERMQVTIKNRMYSASAPEIVGPFTFDPSTELVDGIYSQGRQISLLFSSNEINGRFQSGKIILGYRPGSAVP